MHLSGLEAFMDPDTFIADGGKLRIGGGQVLSGLDGGRRIHAHPEDMPDSSAPRSASTEPRGSESHALNCQMLSYHFGAQLIALAGRHHRSFGHDDIFLSQSGSEMKSLFHQ